MRERVAHEWKKKPVKLHYRVCHKAHELFSENFRGGQAVFASDEKVLFLCGNNTWELPFSEAQSYLGRGYGILIVASDGSRFIAETESVRLGNAAFSSG